jgi:hypothetical protein
MPPTNVIARSMASRLAGAAGGTERQAWLDRATSPSQRAFSVPGGENAADRGPHDATRAAAHGAATLASCASA